MDLNLSPANKNLALRVASAVVLLPAVLLLLWWGVPSTAVLVAAATGMVAYEFFAMAMPRVDPAQVLGIAFAAALPLAFAFWPKHFAAIVVFGVAALVMVLLVYHMFAAPLSEAPGRVAMVLFGALYCGLLMAPLAAMRGLVWPAAMAGGRPDRWGLAFLVLTLLVTWINDTGAYVAGRAFGNHKLYPRISPAKTWEGFAGGMLASVIGAFLAKATFFPRLSWADCLLIGIPAAILGPLGDLAESMLKRAYGVKDSGKLMPGHGGLLDRVDALMFNAPFVYVYARYFWTPGWF